MKKIIIFIILLVLSLSFILFNNGTWLYVDTSYFPLTLSRNVEYIYNSFLTLGNTGFSFDSTQIVSTRFFQEVINFILGQRGLYILFFIFTIIISYLLLLEKFGKKYSFYGALLYTFNPISLYFLSEVGFIFSYFSLPLIIFSVYHFFQYKKYKFLLLSVIGFVFLFSYTRLIGIYGLFLIIILLYYFNFFLRQFQVNKKGIFIFIFVHILCFLPFLFSIIFPYINGDKLYFSGLGNYISASSGHTDGFYNFLKYYDSSTKGFIVSEILGNTGSFWYNSYFFQIFSYIFIVGIFLIVLFINQKSKNKFILYLSFIFIFLITIRLSAKFFSLDIFVAGAYKYFPFIANNLNWIYILYLPILSAFIVFLLQNISQTIYKNIIKVAVIFYCFLSIVPFLWFIDNAKIKLIDINEMPNNYKNTFYDEKIEKNSAILLPHSGLYFEWSPYVVELFNNSIYQSIFYSNTRQVNQKQVVLSEKINEFYLFGEIFNLKNIFVFKDVKNAKEGQFDFFEIRDYEKESKEYYEKLKNNENLYIKNDNENFAHFGLKYDDKYEYFLYSPAKIEKFSIDDFFSDKNSINIFEKPINIDGDSFNKPDEMDNFQIPEENKNIFIRYKKSDLQPTKIYAKFGNIDISKSFLVQLNQTFGMSWKLKFITKEEFEEKKCIDEYKEFEITQNKVCNYKPQILDLADTKFIDNPEIPNSQHFEGNFVGNTWLVKPENIPENMKNSDKLYAVIIYEKQIWYNWALLVSGLTFGFLLILTIFQEIKNFKNRNNEK